MKTRKVGAPCSDRCLDKIRREAINDVFAHFWATGNYDAQNSHLLNLILQEPVKRKRTQAKLLEACTCVLCKSEPQGHQGVSLRLSFYSWMFSYRNAVRYQLAHQCQTSLNVCPFHVSSLVVARSCPRIHAVTISHCHSLHLCHNTSPTLHGR